MTILPLIWITLGIASAGWLAWATLTPSALSPPSTQFTEVEPTRIIAAADVPNAIDQRLLDIELELRRLQTSTDRTTAETSDLAKRMSTIEQAFGPTTGSLGSMAPPGPAAMAPPALSPPALAPTPITAKRDAQSIDNARAPTVPRQLATSAPASILPPARTEPPTSAYIPDFALDLGGFDSLDMVYDRWAILTATDRQLFGTLAARTVTNIGPDGSRTFRLVAGPFTDIAETARVCDQLIVLDIVCKQTIFIGEPL